MYYTFGKVNGKVNVLSRKNNYIKTRKIFYYRIFNANEDWLLLANKYKLGITICIIKNNQKQFFIKKKITYISKEQLIELLKNTITNCYRAI